MRIKARVGISQCLLGEPVRFDGGHKRFPYAVNVLDAWFEWTPVCPEVGAGMPIPREAVRLVNIEARPRMVGRRSGDDWTEAMDAWIARTLPRLKAADLHGFLLQKNSPSCGVFRVKHYHPGGHIAAMGSGLFAAALQAALPNLPIEEEGRLNDPRLRESFLTRVFVYRDWRTLRAEGLGKAELIDFHARHKMLIMAHSPQAYREAGRIVAAAGRSPCAERLDAYESTMMTALARVPSRGRQINAMEHLCGFLKGLSDADKAELRTQIEAYRQGVVPQAVPMTLLRHHLRHRENAWALSQRYLEPVPAELGLRARL